MRLAWKLTLAYVWRHPARMLLTALAVIAAACVVVWVVSGYDALRAQFGPSASEYLGRYDLFVVPDAPEESFIPQDLIDAMRQDPAVAELEPMLQATVRVQPDKPIEFGLGGPAGPAGPRPGGSRTRGPGLGGDGMGGPFPDHAGPSGFGPPAQGVAGPAAIRTGLARSALGDPAPAGPSADRALRGGPSARGRRMAGGPPRGMVFGGPKLVGTQASIPPYPLVEGRWVRWGDPTLREAAISDQTAQQLDVKLGDEVLVISGTKEYRLRIVGVLAQAPVGPSVARDSPSGRPAMSGPGATLGPPPSALYVPMPLAEKIARLPGKVNLVNIKLRRGERLAEFRTRWLARVAATEPAVLLADVHDIQSAMEQGFMAANARRQAWAATGMSLLAALFIIFTTLSMGVDERVRQFAMLRAVGLTRLQVASLLGAESLVLALVGWAGGLAAGWGLLAAVSHARPELFPNGASLGTWCIVLSGATALGGALVAAILPAWHATHVQPLEAMSPRRSVRPSPGLSALGAVAGLVLIAVNPLLVYAMPIADATRYALYLALGCTSMAVGFLLLLPGIVVVAETVLGPLAARLLSLDPRLLHAQLSGNLWRTVGTTVALTVGLSLYVSMMVWGYSMLEPFKPGAWVPDVLAAFQLGGLPDTEIDAVRYAPGVIPDQCLPLAVEQPRLAKDITGSRQGASITRQENIIIVGLDPDVAFGGPNPLIGAEFVHGTRQQAVAKLKQGRFCIVPDHFLSATGLKLGDQFAVLPPDHPEEPVQYTIAGAVSLPGWHWMTKFSGLRRRSGRSAALVFAAYDNVRRDFDIRHTNFFWMNIDEQTGVDRVGEALQVIAERNLGQRQPVNAQGTWPFGARMFGPSLRITTPDDIRARVLARADGIIWAMCQLPLITLLVTSVGVVNTVMASVRARRWELGVLRAVGVPRSALSRMILAEGLLIGLIACLVSLALGVLAGWCGTGISQYVSFFGGMPTPLVIPWSKLALGLGATVLLCLAAAMWPALATGRTEPLKLLQEGRAAL